MKQSINSYQFVDAFAAAGRKDEFSYAGLNALFEFFEDCECDDFEYELDVIAICCDYSEHSTAVECLTDHGYDISYSEDGDSDDHEEEALEYLQDHTCIVEFEGGIIIQAF